MCGRFQMDNGSEKLVEIVRIVQARWGEDAVATGTVRPTDTAVIIADDPDFGISPRPAKWGFPHPATGKPVINARTDTALRPGSMFHESLTLRRCAVPAAHFYEWTPVPGQKNKARYAFRREGHPCLYMAGLWTYAWDGGDLFTVLTTDANPSVAHIHDRMPVLLEADEVETWIRSEHYVTFLQREGPPLIGERETPEI